LTADEPKVKRGNRWHALGKPGLPSGRTCGKHPHSGKDSFSRHEARPMRNFMQRLWLDDRGALIATEWVFVATILVIGLVVGLKAVQQAVVNELEEVAGAIGSLNQSYSFGGTSGCCGATAGSLFSDQTNLYPVTTCTQAVSGDPIRCDDAGGTQAPE
jgi:Flp pilus assembly pilin Flp